MKVVIYLPLFGSHPINPKVFKSFVDMICEPIDAQVIPFIHTIGPELAYNRNDAIERILSDHNPDFIMCCDADMTFPKNALKSLLGSIGDAGVCTGLYWRKAFPDRCVIGHYSSWDSHNLHYKNGLRELGFIDPNGEQCLFYKAVDNIHMVAQIDVFGMGCVLIKADVFRQLKQPYFKYFNGYQTGDHSFGVISEEMYFCSEVHKKGIKVLADPGVKCGHITEIVVSEPQKKELCV